MTAHRRLLGSKTTDVLNAVLTLKQGTLDDVARLAGVSESSVRYHLDLLHDEGLVNWPDEPFSTVQATCKPETIRP